MFLQTKIYMYGAQGKVDVNREKLYAEIEIAFKEYHHNMTLAASKVMPHNIAEEITRLFGSTNKSHTMQEGLKEMVPTFFDKLLFDIFYLFVLHICI